MRYTLFHIIWSLVFCLAVPGFGQTSSNLGWFEVDYAKGCAPLTVTITDLLMDPSRQHTFDGDTCIMSSPKYNASLCPQTLTTSTTFTYTQPGTYSILYFRAVGLPRADTLIVEVLAPQPPEFNITLCNNFGVAVNITDTYYDQFLIDYGDGSAPTPNRFHTYAGSGNYNITVSGFFNNGPNNCSSSTVAMSPVATLPPASFSQISVANQARLNGEVDMQFTLSPNVLYELQGTANGTTGFPSLGSISGNSHTLSGLSVNTEDSVYCFRIAAVDPCGGTPVYSDTLCTTKIQVTALEGQNQINWSTILTQFDRYQLTKNSVPLGPAISAGNITGFTDTDVECNVLYCYQVTTVNSNGGRSISMENCVTGINNLPPAAVTSLTASVDGSSIDLNWDPSISMESYEIFRSENNSDFESIGGSTSLPFTDAPIRPQVNNYCYYLVYQNACGRQSESSVVACAIKLRGENPDNKNFILNWTPYQGWDNGVSDYLLEILDENGQLLAPPVSLGNTTTSYQDPISINRQVSLYRIVAISNDSIPTSSFSNIIVADIPLQVFVPNSFTPNNDGLNDIFTAKGLFIDTYSMEIYSRWGELLFHTTELEQGWNGYYKGSLSPEDTYLFKILATDGKGRSLAKNGTVHLLRK